MHSNRIEIQKKTWLDFYKDKAKMRSIDVINGWSGLAGKDVIVGDVSI